MTCSRFPLFGFLVKSSVSIAEIRAWAIRTLQDGGIQRADFEAEYLLQALLKINRAALFLLNNEDLSPQQVPVFQTMINRRLAGEPLQYIVGTAEFWSKTFKVTPDVLIPRQETEFVVEQTIFLLHDQFTRSNRLRLLDMGTGSGVIADILADETGCAVLAVDISPAALVVADTNIRKHHLRDRVELVCSDLFSAILSANRFDCIVANPPYVAENEKDDLTAEVVAFEPSRALFAGHDGLACYRRLIPDSLDFLSDGGWLILEIGASQDMVVKELFAENGYRNIDVRMDYSGRPRFACGRKPFGKS